LIDLLSLSIDLLKAQLKCVHLAIRASYSTAACTVRIAEGVRETVMGDSWFGSVKTACKIHKKGKEGILM
jgi:hypothetical protein